MFSTSADILNLVLAVCVVVLTFFLALTAYYFIVSIQRVHRVIKLVERGTVKAEEVISLIRAKISSGSAYMMVLAEIAKQALEFAKRKNWSGEKKGAGKKK